MAKRWEDEYDQEIVDRVRNRDYSVGADAYQMSDADYAATLKAKDDWQRAHDAGNQAGMDAAHAAAEKVRAGYRYSGDTNGDKYIPLQQERRTAEPFSYSGGAASALVDSYRGQLDALEGAILNRDPFSYDYQTDPVWQSYKKQYTREGRRSGEDVLGQYAALTGGMPSTAAVTAAQQAQDYYNAKMTDKIPELYQAAWDRYQDEGNQLRSNWSMLNSGYQSAVSRDQADRDFQWRQYQDALDREYRADRDAVSDSRYEDETAYNREIYADETAYNREQAERAEALDRLQSYLEAGGTLEALQADSGMGELVSRSGYTQAELAALRDYYARQEAEEQARLAASAYRGSGGGGSGSGGSGSSGNSGTAGGVSWEDVEDWAARHGDAAAETFVKSNWRAMGFKTEKEALAAWESRRTAADWDGQGMAEANFTRALSSITSLLDHGSVQEAENAANSIYGKLNGRQKARLRYLLRLRADVEED